MPACGRRIAGEIELIQFGLMPEFIGQGLGKYFLQWTIDEPGPPGASGSIPAPRTISAALPNYLKAEFAIYKEGLHEEDRGSHATSPADRTALVIAN
jgi:hypothetical protein